MRACVIDTESGLIYNSGIRIEHQTHIIEFYGCIVEDDGTVIRELGFLCNPEVPIEKDVVRITGITDEMVAKEKPFRDHLEELTDFFMDADAVVGHNLFHDMSVINIELQRCNVEPAFFWPEMKICTVEQTEYLLGYRLSLTNLYQYLFSQGFAGAHRAKQDTEATVKIYVELLRRGII